MHMGLPLVLDLLVGYTVLIYLKHKNLHDFGILVNVFCLNFFMIPIGFFFFF